MHKSELCYRVKIWVSINKIILFEEKEKNMAETKIRPLADKLLIKIVDDTQQTQGGIFIPDSAKEKPQKGEVIAAGPGALNKEGAREEMEVKVGDVVSTGQVVCIVEAMKLMNEIESEVSGKITEICVEDGQSVEYGQVLMYVD